MKMNVRPLTTIALVVGLAAGLSQVAPADPCPSGPPSIWEQEQFVISAWEGPCIDSPPRSLTQITQSFELAAAARFNLIAKFGGTMSQTEPYLLGALQLGLDHGIGIVIPSSNLSFYTMSFGETGTWGVCGPEHETYCFHHEPCSCEEDPLEPCAPCLSCAPYQYRFDLPSGLRPAVYGYYLVDEPSLAESAEVKNRLAAVNSKDNSRLGLVNLFPFRERQESRSEYEFYLQTMANDVDPSRRMSALSFDRYPFLISEEDTNYFYNLHAIRKAAGTRPFWAITRTTGFSEGDALYHDPTETSVRFSASCPIAYGAKGLGYFRYNSIVQGCNQPAPIYGHVARINRYIADIVGPVVMASDHVGAYHQGTAPWGETIAFEDRVSANNTPLVASLGDPRMLVGVFRDQLSPTIYHLWVVNKDLTTPRTALIQLKGNYVSKVWLAPAEGEYLSDTTYIPASVTHIAAMNRTSFSMTLAPGEGRMVRVTGVDWTRQVHLPTDFDGDGISDLGTPTGNSWSLDLSGDGFLATGTTGWEDSYAGYGVVHAVPDDFDGDGRSDISVKSDSTQEHFGNWRIDYSADGFTGYNFNGAAYGNSGARPASFDFDADGRADLAARSRDSGFLIDYAINGYGLWDQTPAYESGVGENCDPVPGDYNGDGIGDIATWDRGSNQLRIDYGPSYSGWEDNSSITVPFTSTKAHVGDFDGDGKSDLAVYSDASCRWRIDYFSNGPGPYSQVTQQPHLLSDPQSFVGDFNGDGIWDLGVRDGGGPFKIDLGGSFGSWNLIYDGYDWGLILQSEPNAISPASRTPFGISLVGGPVQRGEIQFEIIGSADEEVRAELFDVRGRSVAHRVVDGSASGSRSVRWQPGGSVGGAPSGVYLLRVSDGRVAMTQKVVFLR